MVLAIVVSETTSNTASAAVVVPIIIPIAQAAGVDPLVPALAATFAASFGFMLPVSTPQNAIVYGSGVVPITKMIRSGISFDVLGAILILLLLPLMVGGRRDRVVMPQRIAVIPGDGIGVEVTAAARRVLDAVAGPARPRPGVRRVRLVLPALGCETGAMMPADGIDRLRAYDAILLGAVGWPGVPDHVSLWGLLIPIRRAFRQYVNLRPVRVFEGVGSPAARTPAAARSTWSWSGRTSRASTARSAAGSTAASRTRWPCRRRSSPGPGSTRIVDYAFELAREPPRPADLGDQVERHRAHACRSGTRWSRERAGGAPGRRAGTPSTSTRWRPSWCSHPARFDVIVGSNLFGDILSDLAAAVAGSHRHRPSANLDPSREHPSMFEPVHGSAPDIAGQGVANPVGAVWSAAMMLDHLGHPAAAGDVLRAVATTLADPTSRTGDLGGSASTVQATQALVAALRGR